jgi:hypothetical protein
MSLIEKLAKLNEDANFRFFRFSLPTVCIMHMYLTFTSLRLLVPLTIKGFQNLHVIEQQVVESK